MHKYTGAISAATKQERIHLELLWTMENVIAFANEVQELDLLKFF